MPEQPLEFDLPEKPPVPKLTLGHSLVIFGAALLAMVPGWLVASYIPLWVAPVLDRLSMTFALYCLLPILLWGLLPVLLFRYWKIRLSADSGMSWSIRYAVLFALWGFGFLLTFGTSYDDPIFGRLMMGNQVDDLNICEIHTQPNGVQTHTCTQNPLFISESDTTFQYRPPITFEGREGLPFVWYTGVVVEQDD